MGGYYMFKNFVKASWLKEHLDTPDVVILDVRFSLFDREYGNAAYEKDHIQGAFFMDIDEDFSGGRKDHGGWRPLPEMEAFKSKTESLGIGEDTTVVIYDDNFEAAARAWFVFKYFGKDQVYILDGGYQKWQAKGYPVEDRIPSAQKGKKWMLKPRYEMVVGIERVKQAIQQEDAALIDSRAYERYSGENEPLYAKAGHIPKARNHDWNKNIEADNKIKSHLTLEEQFRYLEEAENVIFYCGSGISACVNYLAFDEVGKKSKVYIGSFSDWISYSENPVHTEEE